jgi:hypothetical protein
VYFRLKELRISGLTFLAAILAAAASHAGPQTRDLTRSEDYILLTGADVPSLLDSDPHDLHLYAYGPAGFRAVPFQIDKRDSEGRYVLPNETIRDPLRDGTRLDSNDELVFMIKDAGDRRPGGAWVDGAVRGLELELNDPLDGGRTWAYLFERPGRESPETADYIGYRKEEDQEFIISDNYHYIAWLGVQGPHLLKLRRPDGSWGRDILEGQKMGMVAELLQGAIPVRVPEGEINKRHIGVIDGPVRLIRGEMTFVRVKIIGLDFVTETFFADYFNGRVSPMRVNFPFTVSKMFLNVEFYQCFRFNDAIHGSIFQSSENPGGIMLDGIPETDVDITGDNTYWEVIGPEGYHLDIVDQGDFARHGLIRTILLHEDEKTKGTPKNQAGEILVGYWFRNTSKIPKGTYHYWLYHYYPYPYTETKAREILNMIEHPVEINFRPLAPPPVSP